MNERFSKSTASASVLPATDARTHISVVVNVYNQAHFLAEALDSVLAQSHPAHQIIVIDDGSTDAPQSIVDRYPGVRIIRQANQGLAAARNAGLRAATTELIVFLDADDRLLPIALEAGVAALRSRPECAFAFGGYRHIDVDGDRLGNDVPSPTSADYHDLLYGNQIGMHATVTYFRDRLLESEGFDVNLPYAEDYDLYLRLAQRYPVTVCPKIVAEYRKHGNNISNDAGKMLTWVLTIHDRQWPAASKNPRLAEAWRQGQRNWRNYYRPRFEQPRKLTPKSHR